MTKHATGTRKEWLKARLDLLEAEKELTRRSDEVAQRRQALPWVRIDKDYRFDTDEGSASLKDLFRGRSQLIVYHFMFGPDYKAGCPSCSSIADGFNGVAVHLVNHDVAFSAISRAPLAKLQAYRQRMGWTFPWASSFGSDFNGDFNVSITEEQQRKGGTEYNYAREAAQETRADAGMAHRMAGSPVEQMAAIDRDRRGDVHPRAAGHEHVLARGRCRPSRLFGVCARTRRPVGHVPVARPRAAGPQRDRRALVAAARRVRPAVMDDMPMPGGWTMSMAWMRMPGQTWLDAAASFLGMWTVMMVAMMLPALVPMLWRFRAAVGPAGGARLHGLTVLAGVGYVLVYALVGAVVYPLGIAVATIAMQEPAVSRVMPLAAGVVVLVAGALQFTAWKSRRLACCRGSLPAPRAGARAAIRHGMALGVRCAYCCTGLMAVLLAVGVMDLRAMALVTIAISAERLAPAGERVAKAVGAVLVAVGLLLIA